MLERYKTLGGVLALDEFSVSELAELSGVRESTVRTILRREGAFVEQIGTQSTGRRGGRPLRWRLRPAAREQLRAQLRELEQLGVGPWLVDQYDNADAPRAGIIAAEDVLLRLASTDVESAKRSELVKLAEAHLDAADASMSASPDARIGTTHRSLDRDRRVVELLLTLEQAEQDIAARRDQSLQEARIQAERLKTEARSRAEALGRDSQERYSRAESAISVLEGEIIALTRKRDELLEQIGTSTGERISAGVSSTASRPRHGFRSGLPPGRGSGTLGSSGTLGIRRITGRPLSAEATALGSVRLATTVFKSESGRTVNPAAWTVTYLRKAAWTVTYLRKTAILDGLCAILTALLALGVTFGFKIHHNGSIPASYLDFALALPFLWLGTLAVAGGYNPRFIGVGSDEFRKILYAALGLIVAVSIVPQASKPHLVAKLDLAQWYAIVTLSCLAALDLTARFLLRKQLRKRRSNGEFMRRAVAVGPVAPVEERETHFRRNTYYGLSVVAACVPDTQLQDEVAGITRLCSGLDSVPSAVARFNADTVAVLASPEMDDTLLRERASDLEETDTDLWVWSSLFDVAGQRTTVDPVAGLPLLHVDHAKLAGGTWVIKGIFEIKSRPLSRWSCSHPFWLLLVRGFGSLTAVRPRSSGWARTAVPSESISSERWSLMRRSARRKLMASNLRDGVLFKLRKDPRITAVGAHLRRWSLDELPKLFNVFLGDMSLVGPRPALPDEVAEHGDRMRRRLAVKPGLTGLWRVNERSDLSWDEAERLDISYVENWSLNSRPADSLEDHFSTHPQVRRLLI